jgi:prevent-host-death family protein
MKTVTIHQAKTNLSKLIKEACEGEEIIIARGSEPVAQLIALRTKPKTRRAFGLLKGKLVVGPEFFEPLPDDELEAWNS